MDIPEVGRFSVEKRLWCDRFINWYLSCDLLDKSSELKLRTLKTVRSPQCRVGKYSGERDVVLHQYHI